MEKNGFSPLTLFLFLSFHSFFSFYSSVRNNKDVVVFCCVSLFFYRRTHYLLHRTNDTRRRKKNEKEKSVQRRTEQKRDRDRTCVYIYRHERMTLHHVFIDWKNRPLHQIDESRVITVNLKSAEELQLTNVCHFKASGNDLGIVPILWSLTYEHIRIGFGAYCLY